MKYFVKTFGCQMNESDSERIAGFLEMHKIKPAKDIDQANLVIFNTCGVRQSAENRAYGLIHNLRKSNPEVIIILTGCLADRKDVQRRLEDRVDLFCNIKDFPEKIKTFLLRHPERLKNAVILSSSEAKSEGSTKKYNQKTQKADSSTTFDQRFHSAQNDGCYLDILPKYNNTHAAYVPIMTGCNNFCSYCVVPYARGPEISRPMEEIINEIKKITKNGCKEIVLLGQNVNSYNDRKTNFSKLLKKIDTIHGNFWISFVSNHPKDFSDDLIETMTRCKKVCEYVHLPIQSGDDTILKNMNRKYTAKKYLALITKIKKAFVKNKPGKIYAITSDIIVGFPGETKKQFLESAKIMEKVKYDMVYFGQYSPRPGTAAYKMKDNVKKYEKERREKYLNEILKKTTYNNNKKYLNKELDILINIRGDGKYFGHTRTYKNVKVISSKKNLVGKIVKVKVTQANAWNLEGMIIKK